MKIRNHSEETDSRQSDSQNNSINSVQKIKLKPEDILNNLRAANPIRLKFLRDANQQIQKLRKYQNPQIISVIFTQKLQLNLNTRSQNNKENSSDQTSIRISNEASFSLNSNNSINATSQAESNNQVSRACINNANIFSKNKELSIENKIEFNSNFNQIESITPNQALKYYKDVLTIYERNEILDYEEIYYAGEKIKKVKEELKNVVSFDNEDNDFIINFHDHINYKYEILSILGQGSFGQTLKCFDHKTKELVAIKIIKNKKQFTKQGSVEVKILKFIKDHDKENKSSIVNIKEHFLFRNHLCIVFEILSLNLYDVLRHRKFKVI